ncbi:sigma-70 family RNA polymerase sigma factor [bacterium]|nr:sigma-70 family RNA polymerase sigma factor [bacterium]RQV97922.1 MAG: sigma-70 family RNA polymerase sigma factor [bacterium]
MSEIEKLMKQAKRGMKGAEDQIYALLYERFLKLAKQRIWDTKRGKEEITKDAEDIAQEAITILLEKRHAFYSSKYPIQYAMLVLRNIIGNYYRYKKTKILKKVNLEDIDLSIDPEEHVIFDIKSIIQDMGHELCRQILVYILSGHSRKWISKKLGLSMSAVYTRIHRCLERLKILIEQKGILL